jgi:hypothetical protein
MILRWKINTIVVLMKEAFISPAIYLGRMMVEKAGHDTKFYIP